MRRRASGSRRDGWPQWAKPAAACGAALVATLLTACGVTRDLTASDYNAPTYTGRAVVRFGSTGASGLEADYATVRGRGTQQILAGESARLNGQDITGPTDLRNEARIQNAHLVYNHLLFAARPVEMEWFAGLGVVRLDWASVTLGATPNPPRVDKRIEWLGAAAGVAGRWKIHDMLAFEGRLSTILALSGVTSDTYGYKTTGELGFAFRPAPQVAIRLGYSRSTTFADDTTIDSRLTFKAGGPYLGLGLSF